MKQKIVIFIFIICVIVSCFVLFNRKEDKNILYSWSMEALRDNELLDIINQYHIDALYQDFSTQYFNQKNYTFLTTMAEHNVNVYHLCGEKEWGFEQDASSMKKEIDKVVNYNKGSNYKIKGIVFDIEPYQNENVKEDFNFSLYVSLMKQAYQYAHHYDLLMVIAIPVWFDSIDEDLLEELIKNGCDEISLMNYNIKYTKEHIETEVKYAKKYKKGINTIYEINFTDNHYFSSYQEIDKDFEKIKKQYDYSRLRKAYHYYDKMKKM